MKFITKMDLLTSGDIKREAKLQLKGHWRPAIILSLLPLIFQMFFVGRYVSDPFSRSIGADLIDIALNLVQSFISLSVTFTFLDFIRGYESFIDPLNGAIHAFRKEYLKNLLVLQIARFIRVFLWTLLLVIPGLIKGYAYSMSDYIYKDIVDRTGVQPTPKECMEESERLMKGHKMALFRLNISFIGWIFLSVMSFGIGFIWLMPYMNMSETIFYENIAGNRYISDDHEEELRQYNQNAENLHNSNEEVGQDPDDFSDFDDF